MVIPSDFDAAREVQLRVMDAVMAHGFGVNCTFSIKLAFEEGLINAIRHGNGLDRNKNVTINVRIDCGEALIWIEDQGPGFVREQVADPLLGENLHRCSGRGILLIEAYMTNVTWSNGGRRIHLKKTNDECGPKIDRA